MSEYELSAVLAHGSCFTPGQFDKLRKILHFHGVGYSCPQLPTSDPLKLGLGWPYTHDRPPPAEGYPTGIDDVAVLQSEIAKLIEEKGQDILIVAHDSGGLSATEAAVPELMKKARAKEGKKGGIVGILYAGAFLMKEGESVWDKMQAYEDFSGSPEWLQYNGLYGTDGLWTIANPETFCFHHPITPQAMRYHSKHITASPKQKAKLSNSQAYSTLPTRYVILGGSKVVSGAFQQIMVDEINKDLKSRKIERQIETRTTGLAHACGVVEPHLFANEILAFGKACKMEEDRAEGWDFVDATEERESDRTESVDDTDDSDIEFLE